MRWRFVPAFVGGVGTSVERRGSSRIRRGGAQQTRAMAVNVIKKDTLYTSEPNPSWFGNGANDLKNPNWSNENWLKSLFHFNFAEHMGGRNRFGVLRVMNDDLVQPSRGFGSHPHSNMEIVTYVVDGELTHKDSMSKTDETLGRGSIQFMTAGTGVIHSERNESSTKPLRFIQMWIMPDRHGLKPNYGSASLKSGEGKDEWVHMVAPVKSDKEAKAKVNQDVNIYVAELSGKLELPLKPRRQAYILAVEGDVMINADGEGQQKLAAKDAAEVKLKNSGKETVLEFEACNDVAHVMVVEMKEG